MAWRAISDTVRQSESLASLSDLGERLYWRLLAHSDSYGRVAGSPAKTRAECFPLLDVSHEEVGAALAELEDVGRIWVYEEDETWVIQITDFETHQPRDLLRKRGVSRLPESKTLKAGLRTAQGRTLYEVPAKPQEGRKGAAYSGPRAAQSRREESRREEKSSSTRAQGDAELAAAALAERLDELSLNGRTRDLALAEPDRANAWIDLAMTEAKSNRAGFVRTGLQTGEWPSPRTARADEASTDCPECGVPCKGPRTLAEHIHNLHDGPIPDHWEQLDAQVAGEARAHARPSPDPDAALTSEGT